LAIGYLSLLSSRVVAVFLKKNRKREKREIEKKREKRESGKNGKKSGKTGNGDDLAVHLI
jgi:hypothetical protein